MKVHIASLVSSVETRMITLDLAAAGNGNVLAAVSISGIIGAR